MKIIILLLFPLMLNAQKWYHINKTDYAIMGMQFIGGSADGLHETLVNHVHTFERVCPNANMNWWNPVLSQHNKEHTLTVISDGYHVTRLIEHSMNYFSIGISALDFDYPKKKIPLVIAKKILLSILANRIGFVTVYNGFFNDKKERN